MAEERLIPVRPWTSTDRTGGSLDSVLDEVRRQHPSLIVERMTVTNPADDDNVYLLGDERGRDRVQIDTWPDGQPPFLIEADQPPDETSDPAEAVAIIIGHLTAPS